MLCFLSSCYGGKLAMTWFLRFLSNSFFFPKQELAARSLTFFGYVGVLLCSLVRIAAGILSSAASIKLLMSPIMCLGSDLDEVLARPQVSCGMMWQGRFCPQPTDDGALGVAVLLATLRALGEWELARTVTVSAIQKYATAVRFKGGEPVLPPVCAPYDMRCRLLRMIVRLDHKEIVRMLSALQLPFPDTTARDDVPILVFTKLTPANETETLRLIRESLVSSDELIHFKPNLAGLLYSLLLFRS